MVFNPQSETVSLDTPGGSGVIIGRVIDIIMDDTHPDYDRFNGPDSIGMILYRPVDESIDTSESGEEVYSGEAFPFNPNLNTYPLKNEIVYIVKGPDKDLADGGKFDRDYYLTVVSLWNHPHINLYPVYDDTEPDAVNVGNGMDFLPNIAPIQPYPGDTIMQGKLGTSIRLSGGHSAKNPFATDDNKNTPFIFLSNGITNNNQGENGFEFINEDVDNDPSSFYLTSNQIIPITLSNTKRDSYDEAPEETNSFKDSQLIGNADRVILNAKKDDILLSSIRSIGLNSTTLNLDGQEYMCLDADKIYLGKVARERDGAAKQPVMLGHQVESFLEDLIEIVSGMAGAMSKVVGDRGGPLGVLIKEGIKAKASLSIQKNVLNPKGSSTLKSKKTFVE
jgi:hypothetical protein